MTKFNRKLIALVMAATITLSSISIAFANDNTATYAESANTLQEYGVFVGDNGDLMLDQQLKRQDAVIISLRLMGITDEEFENYETLSDFTDISDSYYLPIIGMAQDLGLVEGMGDGTFGFNQLIKAQDVQTILLRALGYEITDDIYGQVPQMAQDLGIANLVSASADELITRDIVAQMMLNTLNTNMKDATETLGEVLGYVEAPVEAEALEISASVVTEDSIKVTFNRAVEDTSKIVFELTGTTTVETDVAWNEAKTEATLTAPSTLLEGAYTVKASGDTFAEGKDSAALNVVENGVAKVEISSDNLVKVDATHATIQYKMFDKYGVDITEDVLDTDIEIAASKTLDVNKFDLNADKVGEMTINFAAGQLTTETTTVAVTLIAADTGAAVSKTLNLVDEAQVNAVTFGGIEYPETTTTKILVGDAVAAYINLNAVDQYGSAVNTITEFNDEVLLVVSDASVVLTAEEYDDTNDVQQIRLSIDTTALTAEKTVTVTAVSKLSGKSASIALDVKEAAKPDQIDLGSQKQLVAEADAAEMLIIPVVAYDQDGNLLTADEIAQAYSDDEINVTGSGSLATSGLQIATTGEYKGQIINTAAIGAEGTGVITLTSDTDVATATISVKAAAYEKTIKLDTAPAQNLLMGATTKMDYKFIDQYGREIEAPAVGTVVTVEVSDTAILLATSTSSNTGVTNPYNSNAQELEADNALAINTVTDEGTAKVTAKLLKDGAVISKVETSITVTEGVPGTLTFEIQDVPTLPSLVADGTVDGNDEYARPLVLVAKDANGNTYAIPNNRILNVSTTDNDQIILSGAIVAGAAIDAQDGYYLVAAQDEATAFAGGLNDPATKTATVNFTISTDDGVKQVAKEITIAKQDPKVTSIVFADKALDVANPYGLANDAKVITEMSGTTADVTSQNLFVFEVDQYGVYTQVAAPTLKVVNIERFSTATVTYDTEAVVDPAVNVLDFVAANIKDEQDVHVMYQASNGVYGSFTIFVTDGTL